jgi:hypothetical protein
MHSQKGRVHPFYIFLYLWSFSSATRYRSPHVHSVTFHPAQLIVLFKTWLGPVLIVGPVKDP